jgi:hypothetical protein
MQLRYEMSGTVEAPQASRTAQELGSALATRIAQTVGADAIGHASLTLQIGAQDLALPGLKLAQVIADGLSHQVLLAVPAVGEPVQICPTGARP